MNVYSPHLLATEHNKQEHMPNMPTYRPAPPAQMLSPPFSVAVTTPSLVARSLTSSPSSSAIPDEPEEFYRTEGRSDQSHDPSIASHAFDTDDDSTPWFTGRTLLPSRDACLPYSTHQQPAAFVPNPHALPYLPTITRKRRRADITTCGRMSISWRPHHAWLRPFRTGSVTNWSQGRREYAKRVVDAGPWDTALISELAARFIERAAEGLSEDSRCVAPFAREVYKEFQRRFGDSPAEIFAQQLRQCLLSEFRAWWLQGLPTSIYNLSRTSPNLSPFRHLSSALAVAEFAGDLFAHSLAAGHYLLLCINMLLDRLSVLEEVYALHTIVHHAGEAMYGRLQTIDFISKLYQRAALIQPHASVLGHPNVALEVSRLVSELTTLVDTWAKARSTPSPSEYSDLVSEYSDHNPDMAHYHEEFPPREADETEQHLPSISEGTSSTRPQHDHDVSWAQVVKA